MEIVSISMDNETLEELKRIQEKLGFKSRSKLLRATIDSLLNEYKVVEEAKGHIDAVFTLTYEEKKGNLGALLQQYDEVIRTEIHQHHAGVCLRVLIICGKADKIRDLFSALKADNGVRSLNVNLL
jgi:metal-responsive CopG/Arc/MetJ family transcriptional regulator